MTKPRASRRACSPARDRQHPLRLTVTPAEKAAIAARAQDAGLSVASYLRTVALGRQVRSVLDHQAVGELVKVAGDQGRLGGLLKLWLADHSDQGADQAVPEIEVRRVLERLGDLQGILAEIVGRI